MGEKQTALKQPELACSLAINAAHGITRLYHLPTYAHSSATYSRPQKHPGFSLLLDFYGSCANDRGLSALFEPREADYYARYAKVSQEARAECIGSLLRLLPPCIDERRWEEGAEDAASGNFYRDFRHHVRSFCSRSRGGNEPRVLLSAARRWAKSIGDVYYVCGAGFMRSFFRGNVRMPKVYVSLVK